MPDLSPQLIDEDRVAVFETLSERRKSDRVLMARHVAAVVIAGGAKATIKDKPYGDVMFPQCIDVHIQCQRGLSLTVDFNGKTMQPNVYVLSWHIDRHSDARLSDSFGGYGAVNPHHYQKSTDVCHGFRELCECLTRRIEQAESGAAFDLERERLKIAELGRAATREAQLGVWRAEYQGETATRHFQGERAALENAAWADRHA